MHGICPRMVSALKLKLKLKLKRIIAVLLTACCGLLTAYDEQRTSYVFAVEEACYQMSCHGAVALAAPPLSALRR